MPTGARAAISATLLGALLVAGLSGCVRFNIVGDVKAATPDPTALPSAQAPLWNHAAEVYAESTCPTNAVREELYNALATNDALQIAPVAARGSREFNLAADKFLADPTIWPTEISDDIHLLGETSVQLSASWGKVSEATDLDAMNAIMFPDAQKPFEAANRIRGAFEQHVVEIPACGDLAPQ
ncbi:hypothetical protein [Agreia bicolorata]|uniref:Uncharacterized protein n=1 Tax=Agreia bicolorata TaxID=110935 RepID=A0ABR5CDF3_9MICO|nr:hypothetical protein [Agreia bicolorata]KJC63675.1 hypothetical protein TZ00_14330 [Agreia bicolorata]